MGRWESSTYLLYIRIPQAQLQDIAAVLSCVSRPLAINIGEQSTIPPVLDWWCCYGKGRKGRGRWERERGVGKGEGGGRWEMGKGEGGGRWEVGKDSNLFVHIKTELLFYCSYTSTMRWRFRRPEMRVNTFLWLWCQLYSQGRREGETQRGSDLVSQATPFTVSCETRVRYRQALQDVKQMLWSFPLKSASCSLMAQRH